MRQRKIKVTEYNDQKLLMDGRNPIKPKIYKVNVDFSCDSTTQMFVLGTIMRNEKGEFLAGKMTQNFGTMHAEIKGGTAANEGRNSVCLGDRLQENLA